MTPEIIEAEQVKGGDRLLHMGVVNTVEGVMKDDEIIRIDFVDEAWIRYHRKWLVCRILSKTEEPK